MIVVYADETGTHDPKGMEPGSRYPIIAGFAARKSTWDTLCTDWKAVLDKYDVPFFHGRELRAARQAIIHNKPASKELLKNPYYIRNWDLKTIESFRITLTNIAGARGKIPIAGGVDLSAFNRIRHECPDPYPYELCMSHFFTVYYDETALQWGNFKSDVSFLFDQQQEQDWRNALSEVFRNCQKMDKRMRALTFDDKKRVIPLQAADLLAYRIRQLWEDYMNNRLELEVSDTVLMHNLLKSAAITDPGLKPLLEKNRRAMRWPK